MSPATVDTDDDTIRPSGGHLARNSAVVVGLVLVAFVVFLATRGANEPLSSKMVGQAAPTFTGTTTTGETFDLARYRGEWVVVNFFQTTCVPCRLEHPELVKFAEQHSGDPVQVVSVAFEDDPAAIRSYFAEEGGTWPVVPSDTGRVALDYGITGVPESYIVAPSGVVVARFEGVTAAGLNQVIEAGGGMAVTAEGQAAGS